MMWAYLLMMGFSTIILVTMVILCGMLKRDSPDNHRKLGKTNSVHKMDDLDVRVIYNPKSGTLELGKKTRDLDDKMTDMNAILSGIVNENFTEVRSSDDTISHDKDKDQHDLTESSIINRTNQDSTKDIKGFSEKLQEAHPQAYCNPAFE